MARTFDPVFEHMKTVADGLILSLEGIKKLADAAMAARDEHEDLHEAVARLESRIEAVARLESRLTVQDQRLTAQAQELAAQAQEIADLRQRLDDGPPRY